MQVKTAQPNRSLQKKYKKFTRKFGPNSLKGKGYKTLVCEALVLFSGVLNGPAPSEVVNDGIAS